MKRNMFILIAAAVLAAMPTGCSVNEVEENIYGSFPYLEIETESITLQKTESTGSVVFDSNRSVNLKVESSYSTWLTAKVEGNQIVMTWTQNELETTRDAKITVSTPNSTVEKYINVVQDASGELTLNGNLLLRSKTEIAENSYTKVIGNLLIGEIVYGTKAGQEESYFGDRTLISHPTDISDDDISKLTDQIHRISERGLAIVNTQVATFPVDLIRNNAVTNVCFEYNAMTSLPSFEDMESMGLETLSLSGNSLSDISSLAGNTTITELNISGTDVYDLQPLKSMKKLQSVNMSELPLTAPVLEIFKEQNKEFDIVAEDMRPDDSPLPVFGDIRITEISDNEVQINVEIIKNAGSISKAGFYVGKKRLLSEMTYYDGSYSAGTLTLTYNPESLHNMIYHVRAYAVNDKGEGYSEASYFGSLTSETDIHIKATSDLEKLFEDNYSHVNASVLIGNFSSSSSSSAIRLNDGKYDFYFKSATGLSDLTYLKSLVYIREGLYIGNVGLKNLDAVAHIKGIQTLWLRGNNLTSIPDLACRETLTYLDVSMNSLSDFSFLAKFPNLETLYLGSSDTPEKETNDIGVLDGLENYKNLKFIDLSGLPLHDWQVEELRAKMPDTEIVFNSGGKDPWIPTIATKRVTRKGETVTLNGYVTSKGKSDIIEHGFYYGKDINNLEKVVVEGSVNTGSTFSTALNIYDLDTYYYYAYAKNASGESRTSTFYEFSLAYMDLSQNGTANCYIVQTPGQYKFDASVRGNSLESVGSPASAEVVWQFTDPENANAKLINYTNINGNYVEFEVADDATYGNALIAVKDAAGTILWSWHIWICDFDPELTSHIYKGGNVVMDRNLGATTLNTGSRSERNRATGTFYQWGRKDPMTQGVVTSTDYLSSLEESYANPTVFSLHSDRWLPDLDHELWSSNQKTMYDPCPPGWTVADRTTWDNIQVSEVNQYSVNFSYDTKGNKAVYPIGYYTDANFSINDSDYDLYLWTSDYDPTYNTYPYSLYVYKYGQDLNTGRHATDALPLRCKKDVGFTVSTGDFQVMSEYAVFTGNVKYNDATQVTDRGFVYSASTPEPTLSNATVVACGAGEGDFTGTITGLKPETTYYVRVYATGGNVTKYSRYVEFTTKKSGSGDDFTEDDYEWE